MKQIISSIICFAFLNNSYSQISSPGRFEISKIGFAFYPPEGFKLVDSTAFNISPNPEIKVWRQGFIFKGDSAIFIFSLSTSTQKGVDWPNIHKKEETHFFQQTKVQNPSTIFDTSSTTILIDSKVFDKFTIVGKKNGVISYNHIQLSAFINGYKVNIAYNYKTSEMGDKIDKVLATAKFYD